MILECGLCNVKPKAKSHEYNESIIKVESSLRVALKDAVLPSNYELIRYAGLILEKIKTG